MKQQTPITLVALATFALASITTQAQTDKWTFDTQLYVLAAGMSGNIGVGPVNADLDVGFDDVLSHLEFGAMGAARIGYGRWALRTEVTYMALETSKGSVSGDVDQWMVEPTLSYRLCPYFEPLIGVRYNNIDAEIRGPFGRISSGTVDWWDPIIGANISVPIVKNLSFDVRGDIGGFGVGSDLTWQAFPYLNWRFAKWGSLQAGYRWISNDYDQGSGASRFSYDVLAHGPQLGVTIHF